MAVRPGTSRPHRAVARANADLDRTRADPWYPIERGYVLTFDEKAPPGVPAVRPLPPLYYLRVVTRLWQENNRGLMLKARQMRMSWLFAWLELWDCAYHPARHGVFQGKRLDDVDAGNTKRILGRARFIRQNLPWWLQPEIVSENVTSEQYSNGSVLEAIPEGADIVRGKVPSSMFMDEVCFQEEGESNWNAANPSADRLWGVSTPNGRDFVYRQADRGMEWEQLIGGGSDQNRWPQVAVGIHGYLNRNQTFLVGLHYTAYEVERTPEAQHSRRAGYTSARAYRRENELDTTLVEGLPVYAGEFDEARHVIDRYDPDPALPIYRGWDFGYNGQAVSFGQINNRGQLVWFDQVILKQVALERVIAEVKDRTLGYLAAAPRGDRLHPSGMREAVQASPVRDFGDPSAKAHNTRGETDEEALRAHGIRLVTRTTAGRKQDLVEQVRSLLLPRHDGKPGLLVAKNNPDMAHVIAGLNGGYAYPEAKDGRAEKEVPHKDGFYDHIFDGWQYLVDNVGPIQHGHLTDDAALLTRLPPAEPGVGSDAFFDSLMRD